MNSCSGGGIPAAQEHVLPMFLLWRRGSCRSGACPADAPALEAWFLPPNSHEAFALEENHQKRDPPGTQITTPTDQWRSQLGTWQTTVLQMLFFKIVYQVLGKFFAHTAA